MGFCVFSLPRMAREEKRVILRTVDETAPAESDGVIRLDAAPVEEGEIPVILTPHGKERTADLRLAVPVGGDYEVRTHEPGLESIVPVTEDSADRLEAQWSDTTRKPRAVPWGWFVLLTCAIIALVSWSLKLVKSGEKVIHKTQTETLGTAVAEQVKEKQAENLIAHIEETIRHAFAAESPAEFAKFIRHADRVEPLMRDYYTRHSYHPQPVKQILQLQPVTLHLNGNFWIASILFQDRSEAKVILETSDAHAPRIDWETFVCYQPVPWDQWVTAPEKNTPRDFRVWLREDTYYTHEFADSKVWACFHLETQGSEKPLWGYIQRNSLYFPVIRQLLANNDGAPVAAILRLNVPSGLQAPNAAVIDSLRSVQWIYLVPPEN